MENKLRSMVDFVLVEYSIYDKFDYDKLISIKKYAEFLKRPLEIWMFVPCDENGNVVEPLKFTVDGCPIYNGGSKYQKAKERVLFEGFEYINNEHLEEFSIIQSDSISFNYDEKYKTFEIDRFYFEKIEDLLEYNLTLTNNALKIWE